MLLGIIVGVGLCLAVAIAGRQLVVAGAFRRLRRELLAEVLPSALTGVEPDERVDSPEPGLYWVAATSLPADGVETQESPRTSEAARAG